MPLDALQLLSIMRKCRARALLFHRLAIRLAPQIPREADMLLNLASQLEDDMRLADAELHSLEGLVSHGWE